MQVGVCYRIGRKVTHFSSAVEEGKRISGGCAPVIPPIAGANTDMSIGELLRHFITIFPRARVITPVPGSAVTLNPEGSSDT